jgi:hypothetical protein
VIGAAGSDGGGMERIHGGRRLRAERYVQPAPDGLATSDEELSRLTRAEARSPASVFAIDVQDGNQSERSKCSHIEGAARDQIAHSEINVIKHEYLLQSPNSPRLRDRG